MSLMSVREKLNNAALEDGASKEDLLRAALAASNDRYEKAVREQNARLDRLEAAVRASNEQGLLTYRAHSKTPQKRFWAM